MFIQQWGYFFSPLPQQDRFSPASFVVRRTRECSPVSHATPRYASPESKLFKIFLKGKLMPWREYNG